MQITRVKIRDLPMKILIIVGVLTWALSCGDVVAAPTYADSAHGDPTSGVNRSGVGHPIADCAHCHDTLDASNCSVNEFMLFGPSNPPDQADNVCFQCHKTDGSVQVGGVTNRDYSRTFGGASGGPASIFESFGKRSYHNLSDVLNTAKGNWPSTFTDASNPCSACHNVHVARRNRTNKGDPTKSAISKPSAHDQLLGDDPSELLSDYAYQAPLSSGDNYYEPDGSYGEPPEGWGSNMPDYVTFCQECHADAVTSTTLGRDLEAVDWDTTGGELGGDKHGKNVATSYNQWYLEQPYAMAWSEENGLVLSCTDCHEPHGSSRVMLTRRRVNGDTVDGIASFLTVNWKNLCQRCHGASTYSFHHSYNGHANAPYAQSYDMCDDCHASIGYNIPCTLCHFHNGNDSWLLDNPDILNGNEHFTGRRTF